MIKLSPDWPREKQISSIKNERGDITEGPTNIKWIIRECYEQLHFSKFDNLDEMDRFFERHKLSKLTEEEKENYRLVSVMNIGAKSSTKY